MNIVHKITFDYDDFFGFEIWITCGNQDEWESFEIIYDDYSKTQYDLRHAFTFIGYQIATTF